MLRVKDPKKSIAFYEKLGMTNVYEQHFNSYSLYLLASSLPTPQPDETNTSNLAHYYANSLFNPVLELNHYYGTENEPNFKYYNGNEKDQEGFGHIGFLVDDVYSSCDAIRPMGYGFRKEP